MTQPTLPVLGGGERELRDGDRVRLRCGDDLTIKRKVREGDPRKWESDFSCAWHDDGRCETKREHVLDIVLILGQAEETHGDGTVTLRREDVEEVLLNCRDPNGIADADERNRLSAAHFRIFETLEAIASKEPDSD